MKLKSVLAAMVAVLFLSSCSGGGENTIKVSLEGKSNEVLKGFEAKSSYAYLNTNNILGTNRSFHLHIGDYENVDVSGLMGGSNISKGKVQIVVSVFGKSNNDPKNPIPLSVGKISKASRNGGGAYFTVVVRNGGDYKIESIGYQKKFSRKKDIQGYVEFTEISDSRAKGKLKYSEGGSTLTLEFDVAIAKDKGKKE